MKIKTAIGVIFILLFLNGQICGAANIFYSNTFDTPESLNDFTIYGEKPTGYVHPPLHVKGASLPLTLIVPIICEQESTADLTSSRIQLF